MDSDHASLNGGGFGVASAADHNINVVIRVRPVITQQSGQTLGDKSSRVARQQNEIDADQPTAITFPAAGQIQAKDTISNGLKSFSFNVVFEPEATQEEVFEHSGVKRMIDMALDGFACTVFAYGQTSTGKTYTLTGNAFQNVQEREMSPSKRNSSKPTTTTTTVHRIGIIQLSFAYLFEQMKRRQLRDKTLYVITVSYLEVYNEQVLDLLNPSPRCLNVRWAKDRGFYAENLFKVECEDLGDLEGVLEEGCKNRQVRSHSMNENSSRSHSVMTITLSSEQPDPEDPQGFIRKEGRLCLVDLAGSEKTKRTNSKGGTFVEANNINRSLLVLGNCIACLADPKRRNGHIPYRDSTLTKLLADSLAGNGMTLMIACISPLRADSQETISTLRYASRAKRVRMNPVVQMDPRELLILSLKREVRLLRMENTYLRQNIGQTAWTEEMEEQMKNSLAQSGQIALKPDQTVAGDDVNLLSKYMKENEVLRVENVELNLQRNRLVRDHEMICRENEHLLKKFHSLISKLNGTELAADFAPFIGNSGSGGQSRCPISYPATPIISSASSPSLLAFLNEDNPKSAAQQQQQPGNDNESDDNGLLIIRERRQYSSKGVDHTDQAPAAAAKRIGSKTRGNQRPSEDDHDDHQPLLDLTIRGKSAVNRAGGRRR